MTMHGALCLGEKCSHYNAEFGRQIFVRELNFSEREHLNMTGQPFGGKCTREITQHSGLSLLSN